MTTKILFNPGCSNCRTALDLMREHDVEPEVVRYLEEPPSADELREILRLLGVGPRAIIRTKEPVYQEEGLDDLSLDDDALIDAMVKHPVLIQRPIVVSNGRAVVGRPPEKILSIL